MPLVFRGTFWKLYEFINVSQTVSAQNSMQFYNPVEVNFIKLPAGQLLLRPNIYTVCIASSVIDVIIIICSKSKKICLNVA